MQNRYNTDLIEYKKLKTKVKLPKFQRPVVWPEKDVKNFLDSIHRGFPFGSLLLFEYEGDNKLSLIDGLQRYSALRKFEENKVKYVDLEEQIDDILLLFIDEKHGASTSERSDKKKSF